MINYIIPNEETTIINDCIAFIGTYMPDVRECDRLVYKYKKDPVNDIVEYNPMIGRNILLNPNPANLYAMFGIFENQVQNAPDSLKNSQSVQSFDDTGFAIELQNYY